MQREDILSLRRFIALETTPPVFFSVRRNNIYLICHIIRTLSLKDHQFIGKRYSQQTLKLHTIPIHFVNSGIFIRILNIKIFLGENTCTFFRSIWNVIFVELMGLIHICMFYPKTEKTGSTDFNAVCVCYKFVFISSPDFMNPRYLKLLKITFHCQT